MTSSQWQTWESWPHFSSVRFMCHPQQADNCKGGQSAESLKLLVSLCKVRLCSLLSFAPGASANRWLDYARVPYSVVLSQGAIFSWRSLLVIYSSIRIWQWWWKQMLKVKMPLPRSQSEWLLCCISKTRFAMIITCLELVLILVTSLQINKCPINN